MTKEHYAKICENCKETINCDDVRDMILEKVNKEIDEMKVIAEFSYGEDDRTNKIKLIKYLIDKEELKNKLKGKKK